jgi:hypothetical protein
LLPNTIFLEVAIEEKRMNRGAGIFVSNNKDEEEFGMFGKTELGH